MFSIQKRYIRKTVRRKKNNTCTNQRANNLVESLQNTYIYNTRHVSFKARGYLVAYRRAHTFAMTAVTR